MKLLRERVTLKKQLAFVSLGAVILFLCLPAFGQTALDTSPIVWDTSPITRYAIAAHEGKVDTGAWGARLLNPMNRINDSLALDWQYESIQQMKRKLAVAKSVQDTVLEAHINSLIYFLQPRFALLQKAFQTNYGTAWRESE